MLYVFENMHTKEVKLFRNVDDGIELQDSDREWGWYYTGEIITTIEESE